MTSESLFLPDTVTETLQADLAGGLRALADALDAGQLDGSFRSSSPIAGGRNDDRVHLRIVIDVAAPMLQRAKDGQVLDNE